jgi:hypothetical protein
MITLAGLLIEKPAEPESQRRASPREEVSAGTSFRVDSIRDQQIQALVQQLFFRHGSAAVKHVGFTAAEVQTETAQLCFDVATMLAESDSRDVGLIDARLHSLPLHTELEIAPGASQDTEWQIAPRLWLVPRRTWLDDGGQRVWDPSLSRLRQATMEFDISILCF